MFKFNPEKTLNLIKKAQQQMAQQQMAQQQMAQQQMPQQTMPLGTLGEGMSGGSKSTTSKDDLFERLIVEKDKVAKLKNYLSMQGVDTSKIVPEEGLQTQASLKKKALAPLIAGGVALGSGLLSAMTLRDAVKGVSNIPSMIKNTRKGMQAKHSPFLRPQLEREKVQRKFLKSPWGTVRGSRNLGLGAQNLSVNKGQGWMSQ